MQKLGIIAAAIIGLFSAPTAANAYVRAPVSQAATTATVALVSHADVVQRWDDRRDYRRGRYYDRRDYRRHRYSRSSRWRTRCYYQWRRGHRDRVCRRVRYR